MASSAEVKLVSQEGDIFTVSFEVAKLSTLVDTMLAVGEDSGANEISLPDVKSATLALVVEFCTNHIQDPINAIEKPIRSSNMADLVQDVYATFVTTKDQEVIFDLINASNYLDIPPLADLCCAYVASLIKGKSPEQIRATFNIESDFTPEEEAQVREENKWCEDA